ncbi:relaxase/mobilization nuclease domain-containing protein [Flavobacterium sp. GA093]|uniref:Relaxase/mobilization nuclease domain-containing protein n=1 Tax=Flavobacterium hydrocarbonoxydans TaxID=2683249 RepID=A0A6I4NPY6_9FLAO|nr:relaxase/mobilization nuclease domain-containing protein [Flavobacterium hydrocarbonoxydans]MWB95002.1 relaxase/mobilization nuclease domain-containing protein [Flavobacterium hydrocarbonoxydans]
MVAIIKTGSSVHNVFNYNENKVKQGVAQCIAEGNYPVDLEQMNISMRLNRLLKQNALNENVKRNSVHISLNFDPSESTLSREKLIAIAHTYMEKIGFGEQPYLVYQHHDAAHPHIHLVSIKVKPDGSRIDMHNIGRNQSETARKEIEKSFGLVEAQGRKSNSDSTLKPIAASKVSYGRIQSKKAISAVLDGVLSSYKYTSLSELNAVLQLYNVMADRGNENSRVFKTNGLVYRILDTEGKPIGVPIKASDFYNKPTLKFLEQKFASNNNVNTGMKNRVKNAVDLALFAKNIRFSQLTKLLEKEGINIVCRKNTEGLIYGITYVDHTTKCVFNGSALGKQYSAKAIQERCSLIGSKKPHFDTDSSLKTHADKISDANSKDLFQDNNVTDTGVLGKIVDVLTQPQFDANYIPNQLKGKRKKKKRKGQSDNQ